MADDKEIPSMMELFADLELEAKLAGKKFEDQDFDDAVPQAAYFRVYKCPSCPNAHIVLFDEDDKPFAQFVIGKKNLQHLTAGASLVYAETQPGEVVVLKRN